MKRVNIGGQAVIEGVMMKNKNQYAIAIRKSNKEIICIKDEFKSFSDKCKLFKLPIFRGMLAFVESMVLGIKITTLSADYLDVESDDNKKEEQELYEWNDNLYYNLDSEGNKVVINNEDKDNVEIEEIKKNVVEDNNVKDENKLSGWTIAFAVLFAIGFSVGLFILLPSFIAHLLRGYVKNQILLNVLEGVIRLTLFLLYLAAMTLMKDIRRVFEYHGAEHKTINCLEHEEELTVENVHKHSRLHKRCGTSFMLIVMVITIVFFMFIRSDNILVKMGMRLVLLPIISGVSYEILKFAGKHDNWFVTMLSLPGMGLQLISTKEPDDEQIEVAIRAVNEVLADEQSKANS